MGGGIRIRLYDHQRDAAPFQVLNFRTFRDSIPAEEAVDESAFRRHYEWLLDQFAPEDPRRNTVFVAELGGKYAGHLWLGTQTDFFTHRVDPWIFDLSVVPEFRGMGVARALHDHSIQWLRKRGVRVLGLQVMAHNSEASQLYNALGYKPRALSLKLEL